MHTSKRRTAAGFTLVELLAVIGIISLLVGLLLPAVSKIRDMAKATQTRAVLAALGTGLEMFRADQRLGGQFPPSRSDRGGSGAAALAVASPYASKGTDLELSGAGLLLWALAGADLFGTPGFKVFRTASASKAWSDDTDADPNDPPGAYGIDKDGRALHPRSGPYVDLSKMRLSERVKDKTDKFVIPAEKQAGGTVERGYPMFLDGFGFPVLYWRADPAGNKLVDKDPGIGVERAIYHWSDNATLVNEVSGDWDSGIAPLRLSSGGGAHQLAWDSDDYTPADPPEPGTLAAYILDDNAKAKLLPQRADSYLLISPGSDGIYGTGDDLTNFQQHGR